MYDTDVFVAGGGPAGLAAALAARRKGFRVMVADAATPPIDKSCGEGLMPDSVAAAAELGIVLPREECSPFRGIRFVDAKSSVEADFRGGPGVGVRRTVLHRALIDAAERAGAQLMWAAPVTGLHAGAVSLGRERLRARWIIGADGENSRVRAWTGLNATRRLTRFGFRRHYRVPLWTQHVEIYWGSGIEAYLTPVAADEVCLAVISRDSHVRVDRALAEFPELGERLAGRTVLSSERGSVTAMRRMRTVYRGEVALVGDASGSVDAITGAGLGLGFRQAIALADALEQSNLSAYQKEHRNLARRPWMMAELMLAMDRWPRMGVQARGALAACPWIFERLLAFHAAATSQILSTHPPPTRGLLPTSGPTPGPAPHAPGYKPPSPILPSTAR